MKRETVFVLEAHGKAAVPVIESCGKMKLYVLAGSSRRYNCGFYCRATRERIVYPCPKHEPDACVAFLIDVLRKRQVSVLFPVGDVMTDLIARHQDEFRKYTRLVLPPYSIFVQGRDKIPTLQAAKRAGCPIPYTWYPKAQSLDQIARESDSPVLSKPAIGIGARGITFCQSPQELMSKFPAIETAFGESFVQEYIPQTGVQYKVDTILDQNQNALAGVVYAKLRYYPPTGGSSVLNKTERRPDIFESAMKVLRELKWFGFCDFDFITDPRDNQVKLMEINPRYPESYRTTVAAGVDMTKIMYQLAMGQTPIPQMDYQENRYVRFLCGDLMWFFTTKDNRWKTQPSFFDFFRSDTLYQLERAHDWGPIMGYLLDNLVMLWDKEERQFKLRLNRG